MDPLDPQRVDGPFAWTYKKGGGLGMTAVYTHTRPETRLRQLELALGSRPALEVAARWTQPEKPQSCRDPNPRL